VSHASLESGEGEVVVAALAEAVVVACDGEGTDALVHETAIPAAIVTATSRHGEISVRRARIIGGFRRHPRAGIRT
jgi:hypothetical protein